MTAPAQTFAIGERVTFSTDPVIATDGDSVSGEIIARVHGVVLIRPDAPIGGTIVVTSRNVRDIEKES